MSKNSVIIFVRISVTCPIYRTTVTVILSSFLTEAFRIPQGINYS
jgi:hypothetical protein